MDKAQPVLDYGWAVGVGVQGGVVGGKWRQLYLNNNKNK